MKIVFRKKEIIAHMAEPRDCVYFQVDDKKLFIYMLTKTRSKVNQKVEFPQFCYFSNFLLSFC